MTTLEVEDDLTAGGSATLLVIAKEPVPGRVKTRLTPPYTPEQAASLAEAALADTLAAVAATPAARRVLVLAGRPGPWLPEGFEVIPQRGGGLDERLANAFADADGAAVLVGMDTPQVTPAALTRAARCLEDGDAVFGPAADGGFWLIGLREPDPRLFLGVPMSRPDTGAHQRARLRGMRVTTLDTLTDVDTAADAVRVAAQAPGTRFAATLTALAVPSPGRGRPSTSPSGRDDRKDGRIPAPVSSAAPSPRPREEAAR
ncbi:TIGR04282 family arsenosugar biosynthesis glycosyltransferase [Actinoallomurus sp. NPDC050550]|uniref:TIGR04282 family arsenosugar biosynthesis glycosyltransferase n=1 Tax=Actinoallomurus sp. NPDC050550 TaxID=3154937 RepID=UPI0033D62BF0